MLNARYLIGKYLKVATRSAWHTEVIEERADSNSVLFKIWISAKEGKLVLHIANLCFMRFI